MFVGIHLLKMSPKRFCHEVVAKKPQHVVTRGKLCNLEIKYVRESGEVVVEVFNVPKHIKIRAVVFKSRQKSRNFRVTAGSFLVYHRLLMTSFYSMKRIPSTEIGKQYRTHSSNQPDNYRYSSSSIIEEVQMKHFHHRC